MKRKVSTAFIMLLFSLVAFTFAYIVMRSVPLFGDDYYYSTFWGNGFHSFFLKHKDHYINDNGRSLVHILATFFLMLPPWAWQILNSIFCAAFVFFGGKIILSRKKINAFKCFVVGAVLSSCLFFMNIKMTRQSVYWLTGSFNYVFPMALLMLYWFLLTCSPRSRTVQLMAFVSAFISSATTEQGAAMSIGLGTLYVLNSCLLKKERPSCTLIICFILSILGGFSVIFSPATFVRFGLENKELLPFSTIILNNLKVQSREFIASGYMFFYQALFLSSSALFIYVLSDKILSRLNVVFLPAALSLLYYEVRRGESYESAAIVHIVVLAVYSILLAIGVFYILIKKKPVENYIVPTVAITLCLCSQLICVFAPVFGPRMAFCSVLMLTIYSAFLLSGAVCQTYHIRAFAMLMLCLLLIGSMFYICDTADGYKETKKIDTLNNILINEFDSATDKSRLVQFKLKNDDYGWSMPYLSSYHQYYYKLYYGIPEKTEIVWISYPICRTHNLLSDLSSVLLK